MLAFIGQFICHAFGILRSLHVMSVVIGQCSSLVRAAAGQLHLNRVPSLMDLKDNSSNLLAKRLNLSTFFSNFVGNRTLCCPIQTVVILCRDYTNRTPGLQLSNFVTLTGMITDRSVP